jgi:hypothetical protein
MNFFQSPGLERKSVMGFLSKSPTLKNLMTVTMIEDDDKTPYQQQLKLELKKSQNIEEVSESEDNSIISD